MEKSMTTEKVTAPEQTDAKTLCQKHMHRYVCVWVKDGTMYDGIVEHVDDEKIYLAVPMGGDEMENVNVNVNLPYPPTIVAAVPVLMVAMRLILRIRTRTRTRIQYPLMHTGSRTDAVALTV